MSEFLKTYRAIRNLFEELFGEGSWKRIPIPSDVAESKAKAERLPFGAKQKLTPQERFRYTLAKRILAQAVGMPAFGWGLYGRSIKARLKAHLEDPEKRKQLDADIKKFRKLLSS